MKYIKGKDACGRLGVCMNTLRKMADDGRIETIRVSGQRRYNADAYLGAQVAFMQEKHPQAEVIKDTGSGLNFKRKGLKAILERAMRGDRIYVVVAHRDGLAQFGSEIIRFTIESNGGQLMVFSEDSLSPEQ